MSVQLMARVFDAAGLSAHARLVAIKLADSAGDCGRGQHEADALCEWCNIGLDGVVTALGELADARMLSEWHVIHNGQIAFAFVGADWTVMTVPTGPSGARSRPKLSKEKRSKVFSRDGRICAYCGATDTEFHIDHVFPLARGGTNDIENLTVACAACNMSKGDKTVEEWRGLA